MRAVRVERFGGPEVLVAGEVPDLAAGPGQVVVGVRAADVLFLDVQVRRGLFGEHFAVRPPYVPGCAVAGRVLSVGEGVDPGWTGRRVAARTGVQGGYAEQAVVPAGELVPVPDALDLDTAAALLHDGPTALALSDNARIGPGARVLVLAAAGGMGALLVQLAKASGARVVATARGRRKLDAALALGADAAVDHSEPDWADRAREAVGGAGADVVLDGVGGETGRAAFEVTASGGRFSAHGAPGGGFTAVDPDEAERRGVTVTGIEQVQFAQPDARRLVERALAEAAAGRIRPLVGQTFPLERAADAHAVMEARGAVGKTLLLP